MTPTQWVGWIAFWLVLLAATALHMWTQLRERKAFVRSPGSFARSVVESTHDVAVPEGARVFEAEAAERITSAASTVPEWTEIALAGYSGGRALYTKHEGEELRWPVQFGAGAYRVYVSVYAYPRGGRSDVDVSIGGKTRRLSWRASPFEGLRLLVVDVTTSQPATEVVFSTARVGPSYVLLDRIMIAPAEPAASPVVSERGWYVGAMGSAALMLVSGMCWGSLVFRRFGGGGVAPFVGLVISAGLGLGILGSAVTLLGMTGWYDASMVWTLLIVGIVAGHRSVIGYVKAWLRETHLIRDGRFTGAAMMLGGVTAFASMAALAPAVGVDPLLYHLPIAKWLIRDGGFTYHPMHLAWGFPHLVSNLYAIGLTLCDDPGFRPAVVIHAMLGWLWLAAVYAVGKAMFGRATGVGAVALCLGIEGVIYELGLALSDFGMAFFSTCAFLAFVLWWRREERCAWGMASCAAMLAGFAAVCKMNGPATAIALGVSMGLAAWSRWGASAGVRYFVMMGALSAMVASPMYLKNYMLYGNPIYPFGAVFANRDLQQNYGAMFGNGEWQKYVRMTGPRVVVQWAADWIRKRGPDWPSPGPGFACGILLVLVSGRRWARVWWPAYVFVGSLTVMWLMVSPLTRFGWPWLSVAMVFACAPLSERPRSHGRFASSLLMIGAAVLPMVGELWRPLATWNVVRGASDEEAYLARLEDYHAGAGMGPPLVGIRRMNAMYRAEPWAGWTLIDTNMVAHADFPTVPATYYLIVQATERGAWARADGPPFLAYAGKAVDDESMWRELRERMKIDRILMKKGMGTPRAGSDGRYHFSETPEITFDEADRFEMFVERWVREGRAIKIDLADSVLFVLRDSAIK
ncbi:MAG: hypothetical protein AABZ08_02125 [Planctomycetota bacterium]